MEHLFYATLAMNCLFVAAVYCALSPSRHSIVLLLAASVVWPFVNYPLGGHVLFVIDADHGFTASDLLTIAGITFAAIKYRRMRTSQSGHLDR